MKFDTQFGASSMNTKKTKDPEVLYALRLNNADPAARNRRTLLAHARRALAALIKRHKRIVQ